MPTDLKPPSASATRAWSPTSPYGRAPALSAAPAAPQASPRTTSYREAVEAMT